MKKVRDLAIQILKIESTKISKCGGEHEICLHCLRCRAQDDDQICTDYENLAQYIDHTILKPEATNYDVKKICSEADEYSFKSVCVNPCFVELCEYQLENSLVCTVIGFPLGTNESDIKLQETKLAIERGADEIDVVINNGWLKSKKYHLIIAELTDIADYCNSKNVTSKLIIETCLLNETEKIIACLLAKKAGIDFVKTSTGFNSGGATEADITLMRKVVGPKMGVKASGGVRNREQAIAMLQAGANRIGASKGIAIVKG